MRLLILFMVLLIVLISGCSTTNDKSYYAQFKNPMLNYSWDFNESISGGGDTPNSTYFQLKKYSWFEELCCQLIPYKIQYKHEEGHIYQLQLLKINDFEKFITDNFKASNISDYNSYRQYMISVSEGISDYYAISYFNDSSSAEYFNLIESRKNDNVNGFKQHYQGIEFVNYSINNKIYSNLADLILDLGSVKQYNYYSNFTDSGTFANKI